MIMLEEASDMTFQEEVVVPTWEVLRASQEVVLSASKSHQSKTGSTSYVVPYERRSCVGLVLQRQHGCLKAGQDHFRVVDHRWSGCGWWRGAGRCLALSLVWVLAASVSVKFSTHEERGKYTF